MRLAVMAAIVLGMLMFFAFVMLRISEPGLQLLYTDLTPNDSSAVAGALEEAGIPYQISADGARVMVSASVVGRARMLLAEKGLPDGGASMGYALFDERQSFGETEFVQNIRQVRALEGELAWTIGSLDAVRAARVHLVLPKRELFSRERTRAKASVLVEAQPGMRLTADQARTIQNLVAGAVRDMAPEAVTVADTNNTVLAEGREGGSDAVTAYRAEEARRAYEDELARKVRDIVGRVVGFDKVDAQVTVEMSFDRVRTQEEIYDPEGQVVRSAQTTQETGKELTAPRVEVSVANNLPGLGTPDGPGGGLPGSENARTEEVTNFEISKTVRSTVNEGGQVKRLSVSVLVDGNYLPPADGQREPTYAPRSEEELERIGALVRSAIGFDESRGDVLEVVNMRLATLSITDVAEAEAGILGTGLTWQDISGPLNSAILAVVAILVVLLVVQPMITRLVSAEGALPEEESEADLLAAVQPLQALPPIEETPPPEEEEEPEESLINIAGVEGKVKASALKKVEEIVQNYPNEAVSVIRSWMTQDTSSRGGD